MRAGDRRNRRIELADGPACRPARCANLRIMAGSLPIETQHSPAKVIFEYGYGSLPQFAATLSVGQQADSIQYLALCYGGREN